MTDLVNLRLYDTPTWTPQAFISTAEFMAMPNGELQALFPGAADFVRALVNDRRQRDAAALANAERESA